METFCLIKKKNNIFLSYTSINIAISLIRELQIIGQLYDCMYELACPMKLKNSLQGVIWLYNTLTTPLE